MEKSHGLFLEGTRVMLTYGLAYRNMSSLQRSITAAETVCIIVVVVVVVVAVGGLPWEPTCIQLVMQKIYFFPRLLQVILTLWVLHSMSSTHQKNDEGTAATDTFNISNIAFYTVCIAVNRAKIRKRISLLVIVTDNTQWNKLI